MKFEDWQIPWQEFEVVLGQKNIYSQRNLNIKNLVQAEDFLASCGFHKEEPLQMKRLEQFFGEALFFIRHVLLSEEERQRLMVPSAIIHLEHPKYLLLYASDSLPRHRYRRLWSCALLKVMYAIANLQYSGKLHIMNDAREQIFKRIKDVIVNQGQEDFFIVKGQKIPLCKVEWKEAKTRISVVLKLLHKPESIVDDVFDYLGVRFVLPDISQTPLLLKALIQSDILIPHQVVITRTRNTLIHIKHPQKMDIFLQSLKEDGTLSQEELEHLSRNISWTVPTSEDGGGKRSNAFTSQHYKSLQFTVRHLVRAPNPAFDALHSAMNQLRRYVGIQKQEPWIETVIPKNFAQYFPIEIQVMDKESYDTAQFGPASHEQYKASQLKAVRDRILGNLLTFSLEKMRTQEI